MKRFQALVIVWLVALSVAFGLDFGDVGERLETPTVWKEGELLTAEQLNYNFRVHEDAINELKGYK